MLLGRILDQTATRWPDAEAMVRDDRRLTYEEWNGRVNQVANGFRELGVTAHDRVGLLTRNRISMATTYFAAQKLGAVPVPMNFRLSEADIVHIVSTTEPAVLLYEAGREETVASISGALGPVEHYFSTGGAPELGDPFHGFARDLAESAPEAADVDPTDLAVMMHTSGTTGRPKLVKTNHRSVWANVLACGTELGYRTADRSLHIAPLFHSAGYFNLFLPSVLVGAANVMQPHFDASETLSLLRTERITATLGIPTQLKRLRDACRGEPDLPTLRLVVSTGAPIPDGIVEWVSTALADRFYNVYGLTETTGLVTIRDPTAPAALPHEYCIGYPFLNVDVRLIEVGEDVSPDETVGTGEHGRLIVRAPKLMDGYLGQPAVTDRTLHGEWLYTNDIVLRGEDGRFYLLDRIDHVIISGGENIYPLEVERALRRHPDVRDCAVNGEPDPDLGERVVAYVVPEGDDLTADEIDRYWKEDQSIVADFKRPRAVYVVEELPDEA